MILKNFVLKSLRSRATALLAALSLGLSLVPTAQAAFNNTTPRGSFAGNINYVATGGSLRLYADGTGTPANATCQVGTSSSNPLTLPAGATVVAAYLYWGGSGPTVDATVTFQGNSITADATFTDTFQPTVYNLSFFGGFKDVTSIVKASGSGTYTFANETVQTTDITGGTGQAYCSNSAVQAGWALIVIYSLATENNRVINVYDGLQDFYGDSITTSPSNFKVPTTPIDGKTTVVTWEGDPDNSGTLNGFSEQLTFNGNSLTDTCDPAGNIYNSTINTLTCTGNATTDDAYYGVDIDTYNVSGFLAAGNTSAALVYSSGADLVLLAAQVISTTNVPVADLSISKTNASDFIAGSNGTYTLTVTNNGPATTSGTTTVTDVLPAGETYVLASGTGWACGNASGTVTCTSTGSIASGNSFPAITLTVAVSTTAANSINNTATVANNTLFDNISSNNSSTDATTVLNATDLQITKIHSGNFSAGANAAYTLTVKNNGPQSANGTTTVTDVLPASESYVSASGTGWACGNASGTVTCTSTTTMASGASLPVITLNVLMSTSALASVGNTATVSNTLVSDTNSANNSSTDTATVTSPSYAALSTKTVSTTSTTSGSTLTYTITVTDSAGQAGNNIAVTDTLDPDLSGLTVTTLPPGATNSSTGTQLNITGISIAANGTATIVFTALVTGSPGDVIQNTATIVGGTTGATPTSTPVSVTGTTNGNKNLYLLTAGETATTGSMWRIQGAAATGTSQSIAGNSSVTWTLQYKMAKATTLSGPVTANLYFTRGTGGAGTRTMTASLSNGTTTLTSASTNCAPAAGATPTLCPITISAAGTIALAVNNQLTLTVTSNRGGNANIALFPEFSAATQSYVSFNVNPAINVDSIGFYNTAYSSVSTQSVWEANANIYIRAQISDPFGCADIGAGTAATALNLTVIDANGTTQVNGAALAPSDAKTTCTTPTAPAAYAATMVYEYPLEICLPTVAGTCTIPNSNGYWTATVVAKEGAEQVVTNTASNTFLVGVPSVLIVKSVTISADPINGATKPRAIPGGTALYNIIVSNTGNGAANGLFVQDPIPTNSSFVVGSLTWTDGSTTSGLSPPTYSYDNSTGANICKGTFTYTPTAGANGTDPSVTCVKATFTGGTMSGQTGSSAPSFTLTFNTKVN